jgi:uncharacterized membrane protein YesL
MSLLLAGIHHCLGQLKKGKRLRIRDCSSNGTEGGGAVDFRGFTGGIYQFCEWVVRLCYLNILWVLFTLLGLVLFGVFPATVAMFAICRKWVQGEQQDGLFTRFWFIYRQEFIKANGLGLIILIVGAILIFDLIFFYQLGGLVNQILFYVFIALLINFAIVLLYLFPIYVHYDAKLVQMIKNALLIGLSHPFQTVLMGICLFTVYWIVERIPAAWLLLSASPLSMMIMLITYRIFVRLEQKKALLKTE